MKMSGTERSYEGVREIMLKEHVLSTYRRELTVFLAERELKTLEEIGAVAERYEEAHAKTGTSERKDRANHPGPGPSNGNVPNGNGHNHVVESGNGPVAGDRSSQSKPGRENGDGHQRTQGPTCYNCNRRGHIARDCTRKDRPLMVGAVNMVWPQGSEDMSCDATRAPAKINGLDASVLYDTGCNFPVLVSSKFVRQEDYTRRFVRVKFANNFEDFIPVAMVDIDTPYVKGRVAAACLAGGLYDLILGSHYVLPRPNPKSCNQLGATEAQAQEVATEIRSPEVAVEARSQEPRADIEPVATTDIFAQDMLPAELRKLQLEDVTLDCFRKLADDGVAQVTDGAEVFFTHKEGVLYRRGRVGSREFEQLVIPKCKRVLVLRLAHEGSLGVHVGIKETRDRVSQECCWPGMRRQVRQFCQSCIKCQGIEPRIVDGPSEHGLRPTVYSVNGVEVESRQWDMPEADGQIVEPKCRHSGNIGARGFKRLSEYKVAVMPANDNHNKVRRKDRNYYSRKKHIWPKREYFGCNMCKESFWSQGCRQYHMSTVHAGLRDTRQKHAVKLIPYTNNRCMRTRDVLYVQGNADSTYRTHDNWQKYRRDKTMNESTVRTPQGKEYYGVVKTGGSRGNQRTPAVGKTNGRLAYHTRRYHVDRPVYG
jgi:hypothetical protein